MEKIRLSKSVVGALEKAALAKVIDEGYLGMGSFVQDFEVKLSKYLGVEHVVCVNSGTAALQLALMGAGLTGDGEGGEVLVQSLTFVASFQAITAAGLKPVSCEVFPSTCTIDLKDAEKRLTNKTRAIMPVHYAGRVGDLDEIYAFAKKYSLRVIEDAAHAFGTIYKGKLVGSFGDVGCFSFDGIKNITSGEGGAVVTSDKKVADFVRDARLLGVKKDTDKRYEGARSWEFDVTGQGYRYHMSNLFAAIGMVQLDRFEGEFKPRRQELAKEYTRALKDIEGVELFSATGDDYNEVVPHIFPVRVLDGKRDALREHLIKADIECGVHYYPNHLLSYYKDNDVKLPVTERIYGELLSLPLHPELTGDMQGRVIRAVKEIF